ncbi:MAG: putative selenium-dependent hydroxylase accessory protein YqeC [Oscillospiraceae bacterium]|jgi:probable selenium-dependent hydroxylase accessory protein YqeC|nr:putative selenium-dependent hydroxylase accessory protein YqeC [Oscillospiraceae bacterium]
MSNKVILRLDKITSILEIKNGSVVSFVGCGGKTSLIELIALQNRDLKVLVSPTAKMFPIFTDGVIVCDTIKSSALHVPQIGIQVLGQLNIESGKLEALPVQVLSDMVPFYDIMLLEADGSRCLPCKGWRDNEPVVHSFCTHTVGVVTMSALGKAARGDIAHNLSEFLSLTGLCEGDKITEQALVDMVCLENGMFKNSVGQRFLLVNKVEDEETELAAASFLKAVKMKYPSRFKRIIYGSVLQNDFHEM